MTQAKLLQILKPPKYPCSYIMLDGSLCSQGFRSRRALVQHLAISHHSYQRGDVASCTLQDIASDYERCLVLMLRFPECRNPNNSGLFTKACYYYLGLSYSNGCITGKDGEPIEYSLMMKVLKRLESFRRRAQEIRAWDRDTYHGEDGSAQIEHSCILPSEADQALASERASVIRSYEAGRARLIGETFIPSAML